MTGSPSDHEGGASPGGEAPPSSAEPVEPTLEALVTSLTRRCPDALLVAVAVTGLTCGVALALFAPTWWRILPAFMLLAAAGSWGIAERERGSHGVRATAFTVVRALAVLIGVGAVALLVLAFFGVALGTWIS